MGVFSLLGISVSGVEVGTAGAQYTPWIIIILGGFSLWYGTQLKKNQQIAKKNHELNMADKAKTPHRPELTRGNIEFLEWFSTQDLPISAEDLAALPFTYDAKRTKPQLQSALVSQRAESLRSYGAISKHNGMYDLVDSDSDKTVIG